MIDQRRVAVIAGVTLIAFITTARGDKPKGTLTYPDAPQSPTSDDYHGTRVADPYRPLEDPDSPGTRAWVIAENKVTFSVLESIAERDLIRRRLTELWDFEKYDAPSHDGNRYFFTTTRGCKTRTFFIRANLSMKRHACCLIPTSCQLTARSPWREPRSSKDGRHLAYGVAAAGSDWNEWKVRDIATGADLPDHLEWIKFSEAEWSPDSQGFYYGRFPEPRPGDDLKGANYYQKVYYHRLRSAQADDRLVWEDSEHKEWRAVPHVTDDGAYLIFVIEKGTDDKYRIVYRPLEKPESRPVHLVGEFEADYTFIDNDGPVFWFKTNKNAPRGKVVAIDTRRPAPEALGRSDPRGADTLESVTAVGGHFLARYLKDAHTMVRVFDLKGRHMRDVDIPGLGTASGFRGKRKDNETFYGFVSFTTPADDLPVRRRARAGARSGAPPS